MGTYYTNYIFLKPNVCCTTVHFQCYFFTVEFGLCVENGDLKIYGAGLLSSAGELRHVIQGIRAGQVCIQKFNVEDAYNTECVVTDFQKRYFYTESIEQAKDELR